MKCAVCMGTGRFPYSVAVCPTCGGRGDLPDTRLDNPSCALCNGTGRFPYSINVCPTCEGWGRLPSLDAEPPLLEPTESLILKRLDPILPSAAASYRQAIRDLNEESRQSMRGPAVELREALREVLDHLAPDANVENMPGFKLESGQTKPTMHQKARFILGTRRCSDISVKTADDAVSIVDDLVAKLVRSVYRQGAFRTHVSSARSEVKKLKMYVDAILAELLDLHSTPDDRVE